MVRVRPPTLRALLVTRLALKRDRHGTDTSPLAVFSFVLWQPPDFGRDLQSGRVPEVAVWLDGSMPFRAETTKGYVTGLATKYARDLIAQGAPSSSAESPVRFETRFHYNESFESIYAMVPSGIMLMLIMFPAIMSTIGVVREKETGSIANFHSTPISKFDVLFGKQLPYIGVAMISFVLLVILAVLLFGVPVKGSLAMLTVGTLLYVAATTGFGQRPGPPRPQPTSTSVSSGPARWTSSAFVARAPFPSPAASRSWAWASWPSREDPAGRHFDASLRSNKSRTSVPARLRKGDGPRLREPRASGGSRRAYSKGPTRRYRPLRSRS